jgi:hypothetical protein
VSGSWLRPNPRDLTNRLPVDQRMIGNGIECNFRIKERVAEILVFIICLPLLPQRYETAKCALYVTFLLRSSKPGDPCLSRRTKHEQAQT